MATIRRRRLGGVGLVDGGDLSGRWRRLELVMGIFPVESLNSWNVNWFKGTGHVLGNFIVKDQFSHLVNTNIMYA